jgi:glycosyltransferase involved in cell wall biosynthesis
MKVVLILMVRNESRILQRCLKAVEDSVDAFCIHDTGSTDNTCEIATEFLKTRKGCLTTSVWSDFGTNRTNSFESARDYVRDTLEWDLKDCYGLLLDGDMLFESGTLRKQTLTEIGYTLIQAAGNLEYPNCRLIRMDHPWKCRGVTHEYWDGPTSSLPKSVCWINDQNDGGCKADKFERDARLLEKGLADEPENVRYMFYLAQTYHSLGRWKDSIEMYTKRYDAGGWDEERWYSLYMIAQSWLSLDDPVKFEMEMLRAYAFRPTRAESLYKLARYFREKSQHEKAWLYTELGSRIPMSNDALFIEKDIYNTLFKYEKTILCFYLNKKQEGLQESFKYLMTQTENLDSVLNNMRFYIRPVGLTVRNHPIDRGLCGRDFHPTSVSSCDDVQNVRFVNYSIANDGGYDMKDSRYSPDNKVRTRNVLYREGGFPPVVMDETTIGMEKRDTNIQGLEDIRIYRDGCGAMRFLSTSKEYADDIGIVAGKYNLNDGTYSECKPIESPLKASCEKNWIAINDTDDIIYSWKPMRVGRLEDKKLVFHMTHETPWIFQHLRGSAIPIKVKDELWCLVHYVEYSTPRKYFHCIVSLNPKTYKPKAITLPFTFRETGIEYCLSMQMKGKILEFVYSTWDDNPCVCIAPVESLEWVQV